jgi:hypothetical protein
MSIYHQPSSHGPFSPQQNAPSPALQHLQILLINVRIASFNPRRELPQPFLHRLGDTKRHLILEDVEHGEDKEGNLGEAALTQDALLDVGDEALGFLEGVLGVVGGFLGLRV